MKTELDTNSIITCRLTIERCQGYLAHMHALMYLCHPLYLGLDEGTAKSVRQIMSLMEQDLSSGFLALDIV